MIKTQKHSPSPTQINLTPPKQRFSPQKPAGRKASKNPSQKQNLFQPGSTHDTYLNKEINPAPSGNKIAQAKGRQFRTSQFYKLNQTLGLAIDRIEEQEDTSKERSKSKSIKSQRRLCKNNIKIPSLCLNKTANIPETPIFPRSHSKVSQQLHLSMNSAYMQQSLKSERKRTEYPQKIVYNYTDSMSSEMAESNIGGFTNRREKQAEYNIKKHHIETMHQQIGDMLKVVNKTKNQKGKTQGFENKTVGQGVNSGRGKDIFEDRHSKRRENSFQKMQESEIIYQMHANKQVPSCLPLTARNSNDQDKQIYDDFIQQYKILKAKQNLNQAQQINDMESTKTKQNKRGKPQEQKSNHVGIEIGGQQSREEMLTYRQADSCEEKEQGRKKYGQKIRREWEDMQEMNSEYIDAIDKEISKIKERIMDSERVTKKMQKKYLGQTFHPSNSPLLQRLEQPADSTPIQPAYSQQFNINAYQEPEMQRYSHSHVQQFPIPKRIIKNNHQLLFDQIRNNLAGNLAKQVQIDMGLKKWREHMMAAVSQQRGKVSLWAELCRKLSALGYSCHEQELIQLLQINSCESNPFLESNVLGTSPSPKNIVETLAGLFMESEQFWNSNVIGSIARQEAEACGFSVQVLDLNRKGYICVEDIVCFVNLYASKFYRNRDFMMVSRRIIRDEENKAGNEKSIEYEVMENILFDHLAQ